MNNESFRSLFIFPSNCRSLSLMYPSAHFPRERMIVKMCSRCQKVTRGLVLSLSDAGAADGGSRAERGAGAEHRDRPAAAARAPTNRQHRHSPDRHTAILPAPGVGAHDEGECERKQTKKKGWFSP